MARAAIQIAERQAGKALTSLHECLCRPYGARINFFGLPTPLPKSKVSSYAHSLGLIFRTTFPLAQAELWSRSGRRIKRTLSRIKLDCNAKLFNH